MSTFFDESSLVFIPSGYKTSKAYSVKPTDGTGDLTFTRSNDTATRVGPDGLIEKVRTNLALYSEQFDNAAYILNQASITANATTAPNGTTTADKLVEDTSNDIHRIVQASFPFTIGNEITLSVYVKSAGRTKVELRLFDFTSNFGLVQFDLAAGTVFNTIAGTGTITAAGNGWYRCSVTAPASGTSANGLALVYLLNNSGSDTYTGDGTSGVFLWGFQVERGVATDYIATTSAAVSVGPVANVPRLDYLNSSCPRLLLEPQRTNSLTYSEQIDNADWLKLNVTIAANTSDTLDPAGYNGSDKITDNSTNGGHFVYRFSSWDTTQRTASVYAKAGTSSRICIVNATTNAGAFANLTTGTISVSAGFTGTITSVGNGWYRITATHTAASSQTFAIGLFTGTNTTDYIGTGSYAYLWGAQLEAAAYATSYIPTLGASVTRGADACSKTGISSLIGQTEGTLFADFEFNGKYDASGNIPILIYTGTSEAYIFVSTNGLLSLDLLNAGVISATIGGSIGAVGRKKIAFAYKANDFVGYMNGVQIGTDTSGSVGAMANLNVGSYKTTGYSTTGGVNQALLFTTRLTNAQLAELTTI